MIPIRIYAYAGVLLAVIGLGWYLDHAGYERRIRDDAVAIQKARDAVDKKDREHAATLTKVNTEYAATAQNLADRLAAALAKPPAVRIVRVYAGPGVPAASPAAGQPEAVRSDAAAAQDDAGRYLKLRDFTLTLGAKLEECQAVREDVLKAW